MQLPTMGCAADLPVQRLRSDQPAFSVSSGFDEAAQFVVRDPARWTEAWKRIHARSRPVPPLPEVDFAREMIVVVALGSTRSGGYGVRIERAYRSGPATVIVVRVEEPGPGCIATSAITRPVDVARLPASDEPVLFEVGTVTRSCGATPP